MTSAQQAFGEKRVRKESFFLRIRQWIIGKELMERWQITPLDLVDVVLYEKLPVYEPDGKLVDYEWEYAIRANHPGPYPPPPPKDDPSVYDLIFNPLSYDYQIPPINTPSGYISLASKIEQCLFRLADVEGFEKSNKIKSIIPSLKNEKEIVESLTFKKERKKTKDQIAREKVREKATELWNENPAITIAAMAVSDEITHITMEISGKMYAEVTIHRWIHDLCPVSSPGRPSNEAKKKIKDWLKSRSTKMKTKGK